MTLLYLPIALAFLALASTYFVQSPARGAGILLAAYVADVLWVGLPSIPLGLNVYIQDIVFVLLLCAAGVRYCLRQTRLDSNRNRIFVLLALLLVSLASGFAAFGSQQAGVEVRPYFWFFSGVVYFASFTYNSKRQARIVWLWQAAACALVAIAVFRWIAVALGLAISLSWAEADNQPMRVLQADAAMFLCVAFFFSLLLKASHKGSAWERKLCYLLGPVLLLLQHRTVWVVTLLGLLWLFRGQTRLLRRFVIAGAALTALGGILLATAFRDDFVMESLQDSATNPDTFIWRVGGWYQLIFLRNANLFHFLLGDPFGTGFSRVIGGFRVDVNPHNFYVGIYLRFGILGLLVLIWLYFSLLRQSENLKLNHKLKNTYLDPRLWRLFLLFHLMYFMTYYPGYEQCILLGMIVGLNAVRKSVAVEARQMTVASTLLPGLS